MAQGEVDGSSIFRITCTMTYQQQQIQTGFYLLDSALSNRTAAEAVEAAAPFFTEQLRLTLHNTCQIVRVDALQITTKEYAQVEPANVVGAGNFQAGPSFVAALVSLRSAQRARHRNSRFFIPMQNADAMEGSRINDGMAAIYAPVIQYLTDTYMGNPLTTPFRLVAVAKARAAAPNRPAITHSWIDIDSVRLNRMLTTVRRRKVGVGS